MATSESDPSLRSYQPASISSTSSLDSLLYGYPSPNIAMEDDFESLGGPTRESSLPTLDEHDYNRADQQGQGQARCESVQMVDVVQSSVISPGVPPMCSDLDSSHSGQRIPSLVLSPQNSQGLRPLSPVVLANGSASGSQAPEFLYQLTKMLTDDNRDTIEWSNGRIEVHSPHRLESEVLHKYFRHSKFASFQRQLNYFGFRKQAGKGKMAPCSYVNENLPSNDLSCFLHIKRKTSVSMSAREKEKIGKKKDLKGLCKESSESSTSVNPVLAGILERSTSADILGRAKSEPRHSPQTTHQVVAQAAVGRGIRHGFTIPALPLKTSEPKETSQVAGGATAALNNALKSDSSSGTFIVSNPLSQLVTNYHNSLNDMLACESLTEGTDPTPVGQMQNEPQYGSFLSRDDSLVDLAMIPLMEDSDGNYDTLQPDEISPFKRNQDSNTEENGFSFIDFPNPDVFPLTKDSQSSSK